MSYSCLGMKDLWVVKYERRKLNVWRLGNTEVSKRATMEGTNNRRLGFHCDRKFTSRTFHIGENSLRSRTHALWHRAALPFLGIMQQDGLGGRVCWQLQILRSRAEPTMMRNRREHNFKSSTRNKEFEEKEQLSIIANELQKKPAVHLSRDKANVACV